MTPPPPKSRQLPLPDKTSCERSQIKEYLALTTSPSLPLHGLSFLITMWLNPFASGNYAEKHFLKLFKPFSDQCLAVKGKNCPNRSQVEHNFAAFCPRCNMHVLASKDRACWSLDMSNKTNSTLTSCFFFSPLQSLFCPVFFFCQAFATRLFLMAQVFRKAFRIVGLDARKCRWMVEQDFYRNFRTWICGFFSLHFFVHLFSFLHFLSRRIA